MTANGFIVTHPLAPWLIGWGVFVIVIFWAMTRIRYRITRRYFDVLLLGIRLRRIDLADIRYISKRRSGGWAENWTNTFRPRKRLLVLHRRSGLFKEVVITPTRRYIFKHTLEDQIQKRKAEIAGSTDRPASGPETRTARA